MRVITSEPPAPVQKSQPHKRIHRPRHVSAPAPAAPAPAQPQVAATPAPLESDPNIAQRHEEDLRVQQQIADANARMADASGRATTWLVALIALGAAAVAGVVALLWINVRAIRAANAMTQECIRLAREQFVTAHGPRLKVRDVSHVAGATDGHGNLQPMEGRFSIVNAGATRAVVKSSRVAFKILDDPLPAVTAGEGSDFAAAKTFDGGASERFTVSNGIYAPPDDSAAGARRSLCIYGSIVYADELGHARTTAFCHRFDAKTQRYRAVDDADWDFAD